MKWEARHVTIEMHNVGNKFPKADLHNSIRIRNGPKGSATKIILSDWLQALCFKLKTHSSRFKGGQRKQKSLLIFYSLDERGIFPTKSRGLLYYRTKHRTVSATEHCTHFLSLEKSGKSKSLQTHFSVIVWHLFCSFSWLNVIRSVLGQLHCRLGTVVHNSCAHTNDKAVVKQLCDRLRLSGNKHIGDFILHLPFWKSLFNKHF